MAPWVRIPPSPQIRPVGETDASVMISIMAKRAYQFKITLDKSSPRIWRRIIVPEDYAFFDFHVAIQSAMGWTDSHLHAFYLTPKAGKERIVIQYPDPEAEDFGEYALDERKQKIRDYFGVRIKQCLYTYDFGDSWDHAILFERTIPSRTGEKYPQCLAGANACPPEDCGGVYGYEHLQNILQNSMDPEYKDMVEWLCLEDPTDFDPATFDPLEIEFEDPKKRLKEYRKGFGF